MAKRLVIDYGTDTLIDLDAPRQNLEQRFNLGGLVRQPFAPKNIKRIADPPHSISDLNLSLIHI